MKAARLIYLTFFVCSLLPVTAVGVSGQTPLKVQQRAVQSNCIKDRNGIKICQRLSPGGKIEGQTGIYTEKAAKGKSACKWRCTTARGIETCSGSGPECDDKYPPHWR